MSRPRRNAIPPPPPATGGYEFEVMELGPAVYLTPPPPVKARGGLIPAGDGEGLPPRPAPGLGRRPQSRLPLVPTWAEVSRLPRWARIAFAARCARRVLPAFGYFSKASESQVRAMQDAVESAERYAATAATESTVLACSEAKGRLIQAISTNNADSDGQTPGIPRPAFLTYQAALEATNLDPSITSSNDSVASADLAASLLLHTATIDTPLKAQLRCIRRDFARLKRLANEQKWTDDTPVPPEVFGPMWPPGVEPYWAVQLPVHIDPPTSPAGENQNLKFFRPFSAPAPSKENNGEGATSSAGTLFGEGHSVEQSFNEGLVSSDTDRVSHPGEGHSVEQSSNGGKQSGEIDIIALLAHPERAKRDEGVIQVEAKYRVPILAKVKRRCPDLNATDLLDVWAETIYLLVKKIDAGSLKTNGSVRGLITTIAYRRGVDVMRKRTNGREVSMSVVDALTATLSEPPTRGVEVQALEMDLLKLVQTVVAQLPPFQQFLIRAYIREHRESGVRPMMSTILTTLSSSGSGHTLDQMRRALKQAIRTIQIALERHGYYLGSGETEAM